MQKYNKMAYKIKRKTRKGKKSKLFRLTPSNYKKYGYDHYYLIGKGKYRFTIDTDEGYEKIYDEKGNYLGEFD